LKISNKGPSEASARGTNQRHLPCRRDGVPNAAISAVREWFFPAGLLEVEDGCQKAGNPAKKLAA
jgi:hypothetical protein